MKKSVFQLGFSILVVLCASTSALAQADVSSATIKGSITDPNNAVVSGATITAKSLERGATKTTRTDSNGNYVIQAVHPGTYEIRVEATGFETTVMSKVELTVGQIAVYDIQLRPGGVSVEVTVTTESQLIEVARTQQANTIDQRQVENLPNINRNMTAAVFTLPAVTDAHATRSQQPGFTGFLTTGFSIGGSNGRNNLSTIDGGENEYGSGQYRVFIPVDSIQEFQVNRSSFAAELGFTVGSSVNLVTKSGTNTLHGSAYGYFRNNTTQAINFIDQLRASIPNFGQEPFQQNAYAGGTLGGPIIKDKLFYFVSYEYQKLDAGGFNFLLDTPAALGINGTSVAGQAQRAYLDQLENSGSATLVSVASELRKALIPQNDPNLFKLMSADNGAFDAVTRTHTLLTRIDFQPTPDNTLNFRFVLSHGLFNAQSYPSGASLVTRDYSILTNWAHTFSPSVLNQLRVQVVPFNRADNIPNVDEGSIADPTVTERTPSAITIDGFQIGGFVPNFTFGHPAAIPYLAHQRRFQFEDTLSWTTGNHTFKFGASYRPVDYHVEDDLYFAGQYNFSSATYPIILAVPAAQRTAVAVYNLTHGIPQNGPTLANLTGTQSFVFGLPSFVHSGFNNPKWQGWAHYFGIFAQDSWKVFPKLTLDFGARVDIDAEPSPLQRKTYVSPRLGFAWTPWADRKTVIRGGAGVFEGPIDVLIPSYTSLLSDTGEFINQILPTGLASASIYQAGVAAGLLPFGHLSEAFLNGIRNSSFPNGVPTGPGNPNRVVFEAQSNYTNPYSIQASLSIQRELMRNLSLEVGYLMYHGLNLQMPVEVNYRETGIVDPFVGPKYAQIDPTILSKVSYDSRGKSIYHAMTVSLNRRYSQGLQFGINYTYSKTLDDVIDFSSSQAWFRPTRLDNYRAISVFDFPHVFNASAVYVTPFHSGPGNNILSRIFADMTFGPALTLRSGIPFSIRIPSLRNGTGGAPPGGSILTNFAIPFAASRNSARGDAYYTLDMRIQKSIYVLRDRGIKVSIIADGTNILNRVNFNKVWDEFPNPYPVTGFDPNVNPVITFDNGSTLNVLKGPYNVKGFKPVSVDQLVGHPLAFVGADTPRQIQFGLQITF